jgi:hypothetical protein
MECIFIAEGCKRTRCTLGCFDVKSSDSILLVPYDFECINFVKKDLDERQEED